MVSCYFSNLSWFILFFLLAPWLDCIKGLVFKFRHFFLCLIYCWNSTFLNFIYCSAPIFLLGFSFTFMALLNLWGHELKFHWIISLHSLVSHWVSLGSLSQILLSHNFFVISYWRIPVFIWHHVSFVFMFLISLCWYLYLVECLSLLVLWSSIVEKDFLQQVGSRVSFGWGVLALVLAGCNSVVSMRFFCYN